MRIRTRLGIGLGLIFGKKYGIIVDTDYATGGKLSGFTIRGARYGVVVAGSDSGGEMEVLTDEEDFAELLAKAETVISIENCTFDPREGALSLILGNNELNFHMEG